MLQEIKDFFDTQGEKSDVQIRLPTFVFLTAFATTQFKSYVKGLGVDHVYEKPIQMDQLKLILSGNL